MSTALRPIRPRGQAPDDKSTPDSGSSKGSKGRVACGQCRKLRQKCDTQRPFCGRCLLTKHDCVYEADLGETRMQGIRKANRQLKGEVDTLKSLLERLKSANDETKADIMAQLATDELPEAILQRLKDGETVSQNPKVDSSRGTSATGQSKHSTKSVDGFVKPEEDDEPPLPPGIVPWQIDKMHYLLHRVYSIDINAKSPDARSPDRQSLVSAPEDQEQKSPELLHALIMADQAANRRSKSSSAESLPPGAVEAFGNLPLSCAVRANYYPAAVQARQLLNLQTEEYRLPSFIASDGSPLSNLFYSYRDAAMEMLSKGVPSFQVLGPSDRIDLELFFRDREPHDTYDVHSWACELVKNIEGYDIFVQLASIALYTTYIRWNILPTATNYALMPAMIRPTQRQRFVPHRMTIDLVPHPAIRDALINKFRDWLSPGTTDTGGTSVGWPYSLDAAVDVCPITGRRMLSRAFFEHATNGSNWSLDKSIRAMYPEIEGMGFKIRD
ncbi:bZIP transcription factor [Colletotrichum tofieldiae]|uniref:BZIP transcription factor n=1 Tax=Colletotrichum tofieldiae TaxID=708197 RepID=A0A166PG95_9PEZI|nr:bZIP transcription factor [Colletotrichum tofieldiae]